MKKILLFLLLPLFVNSQTIVMNQKCYSVDAELLQFERVNYTYSLSDNYNKSNVILEPVGFYGDLKTITIDTSSLYISVEFSNYTNDYMIMGVSPDSVGGGSTYITQNTLTSNYGMVFIIDDSYIVLEQLTDSFTKFKGIIASALSHE